MNWQVIVLGVLLIAIFTSYGIYSMIPEDFDISQIFSNAPKNYNFSINSPITESEAMFYPGIRFPENKISYKIIDCPIQKQDEMQNAIQFLEGQTILEFYKTESNEQITITCDSKERLDGKFFIAGEGGPTNATKIDHKYIIFNSKVLLIENSKCESPNIAIHELLHAIGLTHSKNRNNILYNISKCSQQIGDDTTDLINKVYSIPSLPDISIENASASINGDMLNLNITIRNLGYQPALPSTLLIFSQTNEQIKKFPLEIISIGYGTTITIQNIQLKNTNINKLILEIATPQDELDKGNNKIEINIQ
jgi:hypothetical protein